MERWAASGAMALTGTPDGEPLGPPAGLVSRLEAVARRLAERSAALGQRVDVDPLDLLAERAAIAGLQRGGQVSCGGATRLLPARDGWLAVSLAREDDADLVPAWLQDPRLEPLLHQQAPGPDDTGDGGDVDRAGRGAGTGARAGRSGRQGWSGDEGPVGGALWAAVAGVVRASRLEDLVERGVLLGLPVAGLPTPAGESPGEGDGTEQLVDHGRALLSEAGPSAAPLAGASLESLPLAAQQVAADLPPVRDLAGLVVVDLSSLWAGPLCGSLLAAAGAEVIKVESPQRPDGARLGPPAFFDLMNAGKRSVALDLQTADGRRSLRDLVRRADVVIEASRPRALEQLGLHAEELLTGAQPLTPGQAGPGNSVTSDDLIQARPQVWVSITGHGRAGDARDRVAFGDDAAVAGGLVCWDGRGDDPEPCFCADAVADPTTGLVAAAAVLDALAVGGSWLLDVAMVGVAAHLARPTLPRSGGAPLVTPHPPQARRRPLGGGRAPALGTDTDEVLAWVGGK